MSNEDEASMAEAREKIANMLWEDAEKYRINRENEKAERKANKGQTRQCHLTGLKGPIFCVEKLKEMREKYKPYKNIINFTDFCCEYNVKLTRKNKQVFDIISKNHLSLPDAKSESDKNKKKRKARARNPNLFYDLMEKHGKEGWREELIKFKEYEMKKNKDINSKLKESGPKKPTQEETRKYAKEVLEFAKKGEFNNQIISFAELAAHFKLKHSHINNIVIEALNMGLEGHKFNNIPKTSEGKRIVFINENHVLMIGKNTLYLLAEDSPELKEHIVARKIFDITAEGGKIILTPTDQTRPIKDLPAKS